ncbi:MAG TPA: FeoB-associated Cys-rich membrane protein [Vicinamibacterales bacterium]|nr:FeoB-associated Cys-rich membrane protein [Vicinamibacterales bacterium]
MTRPARYLLGTIVVGILVLVLCGLALRRPVNENPFDQPAAAPPNP